MGLAGYIIGVLNVLTGMIGVLMVGGGIGVARRGGGGECESFAGWWVAWAGMGFLGVSVLGVVGAWYERAWRLMYVYVGVMLLAAFLVLAASATALVLLSTQAAAGLTEEGATGAYFLASSSSSWLQSRLLRPRTWTLIKSCLSDSHACSNSLTLTLIQSGCCIPPSACETIVPTQDSNDTSPNSISEDCLTWNDDQLCFDCNSCKVGVLLTLRNSRGKFAVASIIVLIFILGVLSFGCCALQSFRKNQRNARFFPKFKRINPRGVHPSEEG